MKDCERIQTQGPGTVGDHGATKVGVTHTRTDLKFSWSQGRPISLPLLVSQGTCRVGDVRIFLKETTKAMTKIPVSTARGKQGPESHSVPMPPVPKP